jgi:serine/threonine protein kinase
VTTPQEVAGRYTLSRRLGAGGMSTVFLATDEVLERPVAVKLLAEHLAEDEAFVARFRREALAAARLQHPNIVQVFDSGEDPESARHFIVMEYVDGPSCAEVLREHRTMDVDETVRIIRDACHGLEYAHRAGVVHRDVKPGNLLLTADGILKLADFGIAKAAEQTRITQVGSVLGTAAYLSPEQARGEEAGPASDIYSLGVCAYQFLAGRLPHEYSSLTELALKQQEEAVEPISIHRPDVPPQLDAAIRLCLEREPDARYRSALEMAVALEAGFRGEDTAATQRLQDLEATRAIEDTAATRALRTRVPSPTPIPPPRAPEPRQDKAAARARRRRRIGTFLAVLAIAAAVAAVVLALTLKSTTTVQPVDKQDVQGQIDGIRQFLNDHSR